MRRGDQENLAVARSFYEAMARGEFPAPLLDAAVEYVNPPGAIEPGVRRGIEELRIVIETVREGWETWDMEPEELTAVGDQVVVVIRYRARGRTSGVPGPHPHRRSTRRDRGGSARTGGRGVSGEPAFSEGVAIGLRHRPPRSVATGAAAGSGPLRLHPG